MLEYLTQDIGAEAFDCVDHKKSGKFLKMWEYQTPLPAC